MDSVAWGPHRLYEGGGHFPCCFEFDRKLSCRKLLCPKLSQPSTPHFRSLRQSLLRCPAARHLKHLPFFCISSLRSVTVSPLKLFANPRWVIFITLWNNTPSDFAICSETSLSSVRALGLLDIKVPSLLLDFIHNLNSGFHPLQQFLKTIFVATFQ